MALLDRYWIEGTSGNWDDTGNWSDTDGGSGGFSVPNNGGDTFNAIFTNNGQGICLIDIDVTVDTIDVYNTYDTGSNYVSQNSGMSVTCTDSMFINTEWRTNNEDLTIGNDLGMNNVSSHPVFGTSTITISESFQWVNFDTGSIENCTIVFTATSGTHTIDHDDQGNFHFGAIEINGSGGTWNLVQSLICDNELKVTVGTLDLLTYDVTCGSLALDGGLFDATDGSGVTVTVNGTIAIANSANIAEFANSTVVINASGSLINPNNNNNFNDLTQSNSITTTVTGTFTVDGTFTTGNSSVIEGSGTMVINGTLVVGTTTWDGTSVDSLILYVNSTTAIPTDDYGNIEIWFAENNSPVNDITTTGTVRIAKFSAGLVIVTMDAKAINCADLIIGTTGDTGKVGKLTFTAGGALDMSGDFTCYPDAGTPNELEFTGAVTWNCAGSITFSDSAQFTQGSSEVILDGTGTQNIILASEQFNDLTISKASGSVVFTDAMDVQGTFAPGNGATTQNITFEESVGHYWGAYDDSAASGTGTVVLISGSPSTQWDLTIGSDQTALHTDVTDSNLTGFDIDATAVGNVDNGNNSANWDFAAAGAAVPQKSDNYRRLRV